MATSKKTPDSVVTRTAVALVPVQYDGAAVAAGETFEVRASDLPQLLEVAAVEVVKVKAQAAGE